MKQNAQVLLINDMAGYGKVALSAMMPVLSHMGVNIYNLPTALVSNTLDYGEFDILDTTEYMQNSLAVWEHLGFRFDAVSTGFIVNEKQADLIAGYCREQSKQGVTIFCDPIMGDDGKLYNGMSETTVAYMRKLISCSDYIMPNYTEAVFLAGREYKENPDRADIAELIRALRGLGAKSVIITSVCSGGKMQVCLYDAKKNACIDLPYEYIPVRFPGTGDIFSAVVIGGIMGGKNLETSVKKAMTTVERMIRRNMHNEDKYKGILIESCLEVMDDEQA